MKLIRCHIENFGVLSDFDFAFDDGLTIICQGNGFGKSTFAAFIKAMFYGFPRTGARNIVENERKRYDPWQGGKYGGYLEFKIQDTSYRVTRYFGKTAAKDTFSLLDLSSRRLSEVYSEKLGEELFRLDADSFARSTYVPQLSASDVEATTSIRTKLSNLVEDTNDLTYYPVILPDDLRQGIRELSSEVRDYRELTAKKQAMLEGNAEYQARANALTEEIRRILLSYNALDQTLPYNICLQNLRKRFDGYREATERLARYTQDFESTSSRKMQANALVEQFLAKYQLSGDTPENLLDHCIPEQLA